MKTLSKFLVCACLVLFFSCSEHTEDLSEKSGMMQETVLKSITVEGDMIYVAPSGDQSGVTDAENIENALELATASGGTVMLTDGNRSTADHYYTSRNIVCSGFQGALMGENKKKTLIHAGRISEGTGFQSAFNPWWWSSGNTQTELLPIVLQLDNAVGEVLIANLSILLDDDQPTDIQLNYYGEDATYMQSFIEILGGENHTTIRNVRLVGKQTTAFGNFNHMNVESGIHVMLGPPNEPPSMTGSLTIEELEVENTGGDAVLFMRYSEGSEIRVDRVKAKNVKRGIYAGNVHGSSVSISNMDITVHPMGFQGIGVWGIPSGLEIMNNVIRTSNYFGIIMWQGVDNSVVYQNTFIDIGHNWAGILVQGKANTLKGNDFRMSGLSGWSMGTGAIVLGRISSGNLVHEMKFPNGFSNKLCEMVWDITDDPSTPYYDGLNEIHNYQSCEKQINRSLKEDGIAFNKDRKMK